MVDLYLNFICLGRSRKGLIFVRLQFVEHFPGLLVALILFSISANVHDHFYAFSRGMKFENVSILVESVADITEDIRYCW